MWRAILLIVVCLTISSHELFLKSDSFYFEENQPGNLYLFNGTFDEGQNTISRDRIIDASIVGPSYTFNPIDSDYYDVGTVTHLRFKTGMSGTYLAGISTLPRILEMSGEDFNSYLKHEGLLNILEDRKNEGILENGARERYSKHVKAILQVGKSRSSDYSTELGYPVEFIPLDNPYDLKVGDKLTFQLKAKGNPLPYQSIYFGYRKNDKHKNRDKLATVTDKDGKFTIPIHKKGKWFVSTIFMEEVAEDDLNYESNWATITFEIK